MGRIPMVATAILLLNAGFAYAEAVNCSMKGACSVCDRVDDFDDSLLATILTCHDQIGLVCYANGTWAVVLVSTGRLFLDEGEPIPVIYRFDKETAHRETWNSLGDRAVASHSDRSTGFFRDGLSFASTIVFQIDDEIDRLDLGGGPENARLFEERCAALNGPS